MLIIPAQQNIKHANSINFYINISPVLLEGMLMIEYSLGACRCLLDILKNKTCVLVTHQLGVLTYADHIVVMEQVMYNLTYLRTW